MIQVSAAYKSAATANGRSPYCLITAGELSFTDSDIVSFEFDDIVHPEETALGTACSNRFHFTVITERFIPLSSTVKAYIGFGDSEETCPLGEFYITYRYRRHGKLSVTCYDRMYLLDGEYTSALSFPAPMSDVLNEVCIWSIRFMTARTLCRIICPQNPQHGRYSAPILPR